MKEKGVRERNIAVVKAKIYGKKSCCESQGLWEEIAVLSKPRFIGRNSSVIQCILNYAFFYLI